MSVSGLQNMKRQKNQRCRISYLWFKELYSGAVKSGLNMRDSMLFSDACGKEMFDKTSIDKPNFNLF